MLWNSSNDLISMSFCTLMINLFLLETGTTPLILEYLMINLLKCSLHSQINFPPASLSSSLFLGSLFDEKISKCLNKTFSLSFTKVYYLDHKLLDNWLKKTKRRTYNCKYSIFENNSLLQSLSSNSLKDCNEMNSIIFYWATIYKRH